MCINFIHGQKNRTQILIKLSYRNFRILFLRSRKYLMFCLIAFISVGAVVAQSSGDSMATDLMSDIKVIRQSDKSAQIDISNTVKKYIHIGTPKYETLNYLTKKEFKLFFQNPSANNTDFVIATYEQSGRFPMSGFDEVQISVFFKGTVTEKVNGKLIVRSL